MTSPDDRAALVARLREEAGDYAKHMQGIATSHEKQWGRHEQSAWIASAQIESDGRKLARIGEWWDANCHELSAPANDELRAILEGGDDE
jgi:hypothetical protein